MRPLSTEAAAAGLARAARLGLVADLPLPCAGARHAAASDRHRPVQIRRVQAQRIHQGNARTRITGSRAGLTSTASSTRSSRDRRPRNLAFFAGKFDAIPLGVTIPMLKDFKKQAPQAICEVNIGNVPRNLLINRDKPPFDNPGTAPRDGAGARPQGIYRHPQRGQADLGGDDAAAAQRRLGHAAGGAGDIARLRTRCRKEPRRSAQDHGKARLRTGKAASHQDSRRATFPPGAIRR